MINKEHIQSLAEAHLEGTPGFLVDVVVSDGSNIRVIVDHDENTSIQFCMGLSRHIESSLDRELQDFSLEVLSPGLDQPLKLHRQYVKNVGREVAVMPIEGAKVEGLLGRMVCFRLTRLRDLRTTRPSAAAASFSSEGH